VNERRRPELERRTLVYVSGAMTGRSRFRPLRWLQFRRNCRRGTRIGIHLIRLGFACIIPHMNGYAPYRRGMTWQDWLGSDLEAVRRSDVLLRLPDPDRTFPSKGADQEVRVAHRNGVPVVLGGPPELLVWQHERDQERDE